MKDAKSLLEHLNVKEIKESIFIGGSLNFGSPSIYGGQLLGQSLNAAYKKMDEDKFAHSLHAQFFKPGDYTLPVHYLVENTKDSSSFSVRQVKAMQKEEVIYACTISFQKKDQNGFEHQIKKPFLFRIPQLLISQETAVKLFKNHFPKSVLKFLSLERPFHLKPIEFERYLFKKKRTPKRNVWLKFKNPTHTKFTHSHLQQMLVYASDYGILSASLDPYPKLDLKNIIMPTIAHSIWFHRNYEINEYLLFSYVCSSATNTRSFTKGDFFSRKGDLIASVAQEGLLRIKKTNP